MPNTDVALESPATVLQGSAVTIRGLPGDILAVVSPAPEKVAALKSAIEELTGIPVALQSLLLASRTQALGEGDKLEPGVSELLMIIDETPMFTWDHAGNPARDMLEISRGTVKCPSLRTDYINVLTKEPMRKGIHYYRFIMHSIGDEQWCGVVSDPSQAGSNKDATRKAWTYYCGRMGSVSSSIGDGRGALHALGRAVKEFQKLRPNGDVIGMLVDLDKGVIAFELNGHLQGACAIPTEMPLWVLTVVDEREDHVELVKLALSDAPPESVQALSGTLLEVRCGDPLWLWRDDNYEDDDIDDDNGDDDGDDDDDDVDDDNDEDGNDAEL